MNHQTLFSFRFFFLSGRKCEFFFYCLTAESAWGSLLARVAAQGYDLEQIARIELASIQAPDSDVVKFS